MIWRVRDRSTLEGLRRSGRRVRSGPFSVTYRLDRGGSGLPPRVAFAIGRVIGTAVSRNRLRRRIRSALTGMAASGSGLPAGDYLIRAGPGSELQTFQELTRAMSVIAGEVRSAR